MSRSPRRRRGRAYQPLPRQRTGAWVARLLVIVVGVTLLLGSLAIVLGR